VEAVIEEAGIGAVAADLREPVSILDESIQSDPRQCSSHHGLAGIGVPFVVSVRPAPAAKPAEGPLLGPKCLGSIEKPLFSPSGSARGTFGMHVICQHKPIVQKPTVQKGYARMRIKIGLLGF
jgi:hypothetical protein